MKVARTWHRPPQSGLVHAFIRKGAKKAVAACKGTACDWPIDVPNLEGRRCAKCGTALLNIEFPKQKVEPDELTAQPTQQIRRSLLHQLEQECLFGDSPLMNLQLHPLVDDGK